MLIIPGIEPDARMHSRVLQQPLACPRRGIMLHYDDSSNDTSALEWFGDARCTNGYTWLVLDDGHVIELADPGMRTPHAGPCRTPNANSCFYGIAAATNGAVPATPRQLGSIARLCVAVSRHHQWRAPVIVGHDEQAIWTAAYTPARSLWGTTGRKVDPTGQRRDGRRIIDVRAMATLVATRLPLQP